MEATIAKIKKNASAEIWVSLREFQDRQYVDVREHFLSGDDHQWHATKKGLMVDPKLLVEMVVGVEHLGTVSELGTVATIAKSKQQEIRIGYRQFANSRYGEIRVWYKNGEEHKPSNKGVTFRLNLVEQLRSALAQSVGYLESNSEPSLAAELAQTAVR